MLLWHKTNKVQANYNAQVCCCSKNPQSANNFSTTAACKLYITALQYLAFVDLKKHAAKTKLEM